MKYDILLAEDDDSIRLVLSKALSRAGHNVRSTDNAETLLKWAQSGSGDVIVTDVMMSGSEVFDTLPQLMEARPEVPIIVISANNTVNTALKTGQYKVFEYIPKPFDLDDVTSAVSRAGQTSRAGKRAPNQALGKLPIIGRSSAMQPVYRAVSRFAGGNLPVFIYGAVGTGKDLIAKLLHEGGPRRTRPFLRMTDFTQTSLCLQKVSGGDIYIDEIAQLPPDQQEALLALLSEIEHLSPEQRPRVISASRKNLRTLADAGQFRDDLLFRINVAEIHLPSLAQRDGDVFELAECFLDRASGPTQRRFSKDALDVLSRHVFRGNVRELENLVQRLALLYSDEVISAQMVRAELTAQSGGRAEDMRPEALQSLVTEKCRALLNRPNGAGDMSNYETALAWVEKPLIVEALQHTGGNKAKAAELLGIHRNTLRTKLKSLNIK